MVCLPPNSCTARSCWKAFLFLSLSIGNASAQVQLDRFYPPAVSAGDETTIKAEGKFPTWPIEAVCDRAEITVAPAKDSGNLQVVVPADAAPGVAWIRIYDKTSASSLVPLLIEPCKVHSEAEPNNSIADATKADLPCVLVGRLEKSGDVDTFRVAIRSGQTLVVSATAHGVLRSPMDSVLQLVDERGNVLIQSDDVRGFDPQIVYQVPRDGEYLVRLFAFPETPNSTIGYAGGSSFVYSLRVTTGPFVDHVLPLVMASNDAHSSRPFGWNLPAKPDVRHDPMDNSPMDSPMDNSSTQVAYLAEALGWQWQQTGSNESTIMHEIGNNGSTSDVIDLPCVFSGHIGQPAEVDRLRFHVQSGKKYRVAVHSRQFKFTLDSVLRLVDPKDGSELARNDDRSRNEYDAEIDYSAKADGELELQISDLFDAFGPRHAYSVVIEESKPTVSLSLADDHFVAKAGETVEVPVTLSRLAGFNQKLRVTAEGLPAGVRAEAVVSETKGDSAKSVKLKITADKDALYQGTFHVVGQPLDSEGNPTSETFTAVHPLRDVVQVKDIWLTIHSR